jgi:type IV fimbrial biogenesis protein FimT
MTIKLSVTNAGFTLIELMVTLSIVALLLGLATPSFTAFFKDNRISTQVNEFVSSLNFARSESIKRGVRITLCKSNTGNSCATTGDWSQGFIIFTDQSNPALIPVYDSTSETLLKVKKALRGNVSIIGNTNVADYISYMPSGQNLKISGAVQTGTLTICDDRGGQNVGKEIVISNTGRSRIEKDISC